ncbi:MAG: methionyl-tRNA formyltransferase [Heliobacteriaceae bacterium]|nr:methionyl-tRNA formyltransferase [Heliobacteriaceae bacterium]
MRIVFMGTPDFAVPTLKALIAANYEVVLVVTRPDRRQGRGQKTAPSPVKKAAVELGIPVLHPGKLDQEFAVELQARQIDVGVVVAYGRILPPVLLSALPGRWINVHASLLPKYRGAAPIHRAVMAGEPVTGITTMLLAEEMDAGDILLQEPVPVECEATVGEIHDRLASVGAQLLVKTLSLWEQGGLESSPQQHARATYAPVITREDERVQWWQPATAIHNQVRGLNPWPGAYMLAGGKIVKIRQGRLRHEEMGRELPGQPGEIVGLEGEEVAIFTGAGIYWLTEVQPAGGKTMTAGAYVRGRRIGKGYCFG